MTKSRNINKPRFVWQPWQDDILRCTYPCTANVALCKVLGVTPNQVNYRAQKLGIKKTKWFWQNHPTSGAIIVSGKPHHGTRFVKGQTSWNKGRKGLCFAGCEVGWFKKGTSPKNKKEIGYMRRNGRDGYYEIKMHETGVKYKDWVPIHRLIYERMHGIKIPKTHVVMYLDGNYENWRIQNLRMISKAENAKRNSIHNYPKEIATAMQLVGAINRQINKRSKQHDTNERHGIN